MNVIENKICSFILIFLFSLSCLGFFNPNWYSLAFYSLLFLLFYSAKVNTEKKHWMTVIFIVPIVLATKNSLIIPQIYEANNVFIGGENYKDSIFKEGLPKKIFNKLYDDYQSAFPDSIAGPAPYLYDKSVTQMIKKTSQTRLVETIEWRNRYQLQLGAFNDTKYNAYGKQQPSRAKLPFFVKYSFPSDYSNSKAKFCWQGLGYVGSSLEKKEFKNIECLNFTNISINKNNLFDIWLLETGKTMPLQAKLYLPIKFQIYVYIKHILSFFSGLLILYLLFKKVNLNKAFFFITSFIISFLFSIYFYPNLLNKFILFEGGNDGLLYVHFAHLISDSIATGDLMSAFMGGEKAYDLMPFYRYIWIVNYLLFEESPWMLLFILTFFPLVIYNIFKQLLNKKWAVVFLLFWFIIPIFEAFGFYHYYYVKLTLRGFGEPLSYLLFLSALSLLIKFNLYKNGINYYNTIIFGLLLSLAIGLRANILPACLVLILFFLLVTLKKANILNYLFFLLGFSLVLIMPIHNYVFTEKFIPLTIAAYKDWNLGAKPSDYITLMKSLFFLRFDYEAWNKIIDHVNGEIKIYEIWYHISIIVSVYCIISKRFPITIKCISLCSLSLVFLILFYHVGGRYSYLTWTLSLIVLSYWLKNVMFPILKRNNKVNAT
ncbi:MAG: hypothetical protein CMP36_00560 [Rickettsiales bacterium]|nr:hypothetical protein [Rickettsiales bacterium]OUV83221.1 MAG: hypothetical protein CBC91_00940 [Rickettsiales bacterium TMED131]